MKYLKISGSSSQYFLGRPSLSQKRKNTISFEKKENYFLLSWIYEIRKQSENSCRIQFEPKNQPLALFEQQRCDLPIASVIWS